MRKRPHSSVRSIFRAAILCLITGAAIHAFGESPKAYFVDGYHGGYYGHYPEWCTQFMVDQLAQHPDWKINLEIEPETWDWARTNTPDAYKAFKQLSDAQPSRVEFVNPAYAQAYLWNISGESVIRQFDYGIRKVREHFPNARFKTYSSEEPCFTSALPGILKSFGFDYAVLKNPDTCWGGYTRAFGGELVNWIGPDGTGIVTVPRYEIETLKPGSTWETIAAQNSKNYIAAAFGYGIARPVGMCLQDAGWRNGPWLGDGKHSYQPTEYVAWSDYIAAACSNQPPKQDWRFSQEDVQVSLVWGGQVLQRITQQVRQAENRLLTAEKLATLAQVYQTVPWPKSSLDEAWRTLMLSQHHDCWIVPYNGRRNNTWADNVVRWTDATKQRSDAVIHDSTAALSPGTSTNQLTCVRVFNTLGVERLDLATVPLPTDWDAPEARVTDAEGRTIVSQVVSNSEGKTLLFEARVSGLGYSSYRIEKMQKGFVGAMAKQLPDGTYQLKNDFYTIVLDPNRGGAIRSLKLTGNKEWVERGNERSFNEIRGYFFEENQYHSTAENAAIIDVLENGPVRVRVEIKGKVGKHPISQMITLVKHQPKIDMSCRIDWQGSPGIGASYSQNAFNGSDNQKAFYDDRSKLRVFFPVNIISQKVYKNAPFDVTESKLEDTFFTTWDGIKNNIILNWVDVADRENTCGMALLADHTTSYGHGTNVPLSLTLQYSGVGLWGRNYRLDGPTQINYALVPHPGQWAQAKIWTADHAWNEPLIATLAPSLEKRSLLDVTGSGFDVSALTVDGNDVVVRLFNAEGNDKPQKLTFDIPSTRVDWVKLNGEIIRTLSIEKGKDGKSFVSIALPKFGFATLRFKK